MDTNEPTQKPIRLKKDGTPDRRQCRRADGTSINPTPKGSTRPRQYRPRSNAGSRRPPNRPQDATRGPIDVQALARGEKPIEELSINERKLLERFVRTGTLPKVSEKIRAFDDAYLEFDRRLEEVVTGARAPDAAQLLSTVRDMKMRLFESERLVRAYQQRERKDGEIRHVRASFEANEAIEVVAERLHRSKSWVDTQYRALRNEAAARELEAQAAEEAKSESEGATRPLTPELLDRLFAIATERDRRVAEGLEAPFEGEGGGHG